MGRKRKKSKKRNSRRGYGEGDDDTMEFVNTPNVMGAFNKSPI